MNDKCPVCESTIPEPDRINRDNERYSCVRCGSFILPISLASKLLSMLDGEDEKIATLSHWIRSEHETRALNSLSPDIPILDHKLIESILRQKPPTPAEQANNIIRWIGENTKAWGEFLKLKPEEHMSIMGSMTQKEFLWVIDHLIESGIMKGDKFLEGTAKIRLSFEGWEHYEELKRGATDTWKAFMAMKYGEPVLDKVVDEIFKPAVKQTGFDLFRLADRPKAGLIDDRLRVEIQTSRFLIADLTHENAGAYWEAGYAEGLGKPVIYTCEKEKFEGRKTHFDTNHHLTVVWQIGKEKESAEELKATIRATLPGEAKLIDE